MVFGWILSFNFKVLFVWFKDEGLLGFGFQVRSASDFYAMLVDIALLHWVLGG